MCNTRFITKDDSKILYGIAICLMVWHHLFAFPERIEVPYVLALNYSFETILSYFGRICISIFAMISGYGMAFKMKEVHYNKKDFLLQSYKCVFDSLVSFFKRYWSVFLVFVPLGILMGKNYSFLDIVKNFVGFSCSINAEWWYVRQYIVMMIFLPVIIWIVDVLEDKMSQVKVICVYSLFLLTMFFLIYKGKVSDGFTVTLCFIQGVTIYKLSIYEKMEKFLHRLIKNDTLNGMIILTFVFIVRTKLTSSCRYDYLYTAMFIFGLILLFKNQIVRKSIGRVFAFLGNYSTFIWLTHTFFIYYYFQKISFMPYYSPLIFLWVMVINTCIAMLLLKVTKRLDIYK